MFTFGLFSTHAPYLIFIGFYLSYFFYSFQAEEKHHFADQIVLETYAQAFSQNDSSETAYYSTFSHQKQSADQAEQVPFGSVSICVPRSEKLFAPPIIHLSVYFAGKIFNRPPPAR